MQVKVAVLGLPPDVERSAEVVRVNADPDAEGDGVAACESNGE
jgi:hypothetical protein